MKTKPAAASSRREKLVVRSEANIRRYIKSPKAKRDATLASAGGPDPTARDLRQIPELTSSQLARLYRPIKQKISVRLDRDVLAWLKSGDGGYQTRLNRILREAMQAVQREP
jgi:uncharacterized protein (DUF4415 family)